MATEVTGTSISWITGFETGENQTFQQQQWPGQQPSQRTWWKYFWTHGVWAHNNNEYATLAPGHQPQATYNNCMEIVLSSTNC